MAEAFQGVVGAKRGDVKTMTSQLPRDSEPHCHLTAIAWLKKKAVKPEAYTYIASCGTTLPGELFPKPRNALQLLIIIGSPCTTISSDGKQRSLSRPAVLEIYETYAGITDVHNHLRQGILALEKCWVTQRWDFRLFTTIIGICVVDAFLLSQKFAVHLQASDARLAFFVDILCRELCTSGIQGMLAENPKFSPSTPQTTSEAPWHQLCKFPRMVKRRKVDKEEYSAQYQAACRYCAVKRCIPNQKTAFFCSMCLMAICSPEVGRDCFTQHIIEGFVSPSTSATLAYMKTEDSQPQ